METAPTNCVVCGADAATPIARGRDYIYHGSSDYFTHVACSACGHIYMNPRPTRNALPIMYPANYGTFSKKFSGADNFLARIKNRVNMKRFANVAGHLSARACILDVGCGNGELLLALAKRHLDFQLWGLDWHFPAKTRARLEGAGISLIEGALESVELPPDRFDLILMNQLIEHLWEPRLALARLAQSLKPGGRIAIETPDTDGYDRRFFSGGTWGGYYAPRHLNLFNASRLAKLVTEPGLAVLHQTSLPAPVIWCYSLQATMEERFGDNSAPARFFDLRNLPALGAFAILDKLVSSLLKVRTSNQQMVAQKPAASGRIG